MFLARKITRAKWSNRRGLAVAEIPADGITVDLRTQGNKLSFWQCPTDAETDLEAAALALAAGRDSLDKLEFIWFTYDDLRNDGLTANSTRGRTPVRDLRDLHVDVEQLDYVRLGTLARKVVAALDADRYCRFSKAGVKRLIVNALDQDRIDLDAISTNLLGEVRN